MLPASLFRDYASDSHDSASADALRQRGLVLGGLGKIWVGQDENQGDKETDGSVPARNSRERPEVKRGCR